MILEKINRRQKCPECLRNMLCLYTSILFLFIQGILTSPHQQHIIFDNSASVLDFVFLTVNNT